MTVRLRLPVRPALPLRPPSVLGIVLVAVTKTADLVTTYIGLSAFESVVELNPVGAFVFESAGGAGLLALSVAVLAAVVVVVESAYAYLDSVTGDVPSPEIVYAISYFPLSLVFGATALANLRLLVAAP